MEHVSDDNVLTEKGGYRRMVFAQSNSGNSTDNRSNANAPAMKARVQRSRVLNQKLRTGFSASHPQASVAQDSAAGANDTVGGAKPFGFVFGAVSPEKRGPEAYSLPNSVRPRTTEGATQNGANGLGQLDASAENFTFVFNSPRGDVTPKVVRKSSSQPRSSPRCSSKVQSPVSRQREVHELPSGDKLTVRFKIPASLADKLQTAGNLAEKIKSETPERPPRTSNFTNSPGNLSFQVPCPGLSQTSGVSRASFHTAYENFVVTSDSDDSVKGVSHSHATRQTGRNAVAPSPGTSEVNIASPTCYASAGSSAGSGGVASPAQFASCLADEAEATSSLRPSTGTAPGASSPVTPVIFWTGSESPGDSDCTPFGQAETPGVSSVRRSQRTKDQTPGAFGSVNGLREQDKERSAAVGNCTSRPSVATDGMAGRFQSVLNFDEDGVHMQPIPATNSQTGASPSGNFGFTFGSKHSGKAKRSPASSRKVKHTAWSSQATQPTPLPTPMPAATPMSYVGGDTPAWGQTPFAGSPMDFSPYPADYNPNAATTNPTNILFATQSSNNMQPWQSQPVFPTASLRPQAAPASQPQPAFPTVAAKNADSQPPLRPTAPPASAVSSAVPAMPQVFSSHVPAKKQALGQQTAAAPPPAGTAGSAPAKRSSPTFPSQEQAHVPTSSNMQSQISAASAFGSTTSTAPFAVPQPQAQPFASNSNSQGCFWDAAPAFSFQAATPPKTTSNASFHSKSADTATLPEHFGQMYVDPVPRVAADFSVKCSTGTVDEQQARPCASRAAPSPTRAAKASSRKTQRGKPRKSREKGTGKLDGVDASWNFGSDAPWRTAAGAPAMPTSWPPSAADLTSQPHVTTAAPSATPPMQQAESSAGDAFVRKAMATAESYHKQGNDAYKLGQFDKAKAAYSKGIQALNAFPNAPFSDWYSTLASNRAAALLNLHDPLGAIDDCKLALQHRPRFARAACRMAACHYQLGEFGSALEVLHSTKELYVSSGREKGEKELEYQEHITRLDKKLAEVQAVVTGIAEARQSIQRSADIEGVERGLKVLESQWAWVSYADNAYCLKAEAYLRRHRLSQVISIVNSTTPRASSRNETVAKHWRWWLTAQAHFHAGDVEKAKQWLGKGVSYSSSAPEGRIAIPELHGVDGEVWGQIRLPTAAELMAIQEGLQQLHTAKEQGNQAVKAGKYSDAISIYTTALSTWQPLCTPMFAAVLYGNRAAAHQGLGNVADALADCGRAKALNPEYGKAYSRMAAILTDMGRWDCAASVLQAMSTLTTLTSKERSDLHTRLQAARTPLRRGQGNHYKLLGLDTSCTTEEIRKAYKKLALCFHPDKAMSNCKFSMQLGEAGVALAGQLAAENRVREEADWLFKRIGEAQAVLVDPQKRRGLDMELMMPTRAYGMAGSFRPTSRSTSRYEPFFNRDDFSSYFRTSSGTRYHASNRGGAASGHRSDDSDDDYFGSFPGGSYRRDG